MIEWVFKKKKTFSSFNNECVETRCKMKDSYYKLCEVLCFKPKSITRPIYMEKKNKKT